MQSGLRGLLDVHALKVQRTFSRNRNFTDFSLPGCKIEQSCFLRSKYYSEVYGEFFGSLLPLEPTSMTTVKHRRDIDTSYGSHPHRNKKIEIIIGVRDDGASVSSGSGVSRRRVLSWGDRPG